MRKKPDKERYEGGVSEGIGRSYLGLKGSISTSFYVPTRPYERSGAGQDCCLSLSPPAIPVLAAAPERKEKKKKEGVQPASRMPAARHLRMSLLAWTPNNPVDPPIKVDDGLGWLRVAGVATFASWPLQPFMYVLYICGLRPKGKT